MATGTILVIEDNSIQRDELVTILQQQGYRVLTATDGSEALKQLISEPFPDLILLKMLIPKGHRDGWWFLEQRQSIPELIAVPVIIMTTLAVASDTWAESLGATGLIRKPFQAESLMAEIRRCLG